MESTWQLSYTESKVFNKVSHNWCLLDTLEWRDTAIPCSVQTSAFGMPLKELYALDNIRKVDWMRDKYWIFRTRFSKPLIEEDEEAVYQFLGIDYVYTIYLNSKKVLEREGMFSIVEIGLEDAKENNELLVILKPFAENRQTPENIKSRFVAGYGWDFAPDILSAGIWDDARIVVRKKLRITDAYVSTTLCNLERADVTVYIDISRKLEMGSVVLELDGVKRTYPVVNTDKLALPVNIPSPTLWWPNGMGQPQLVSLKIFLFENGHEAAAYEQKVGLRSIGRVACKDQGVEDIPLQLVINGNKVFIKGINWVPLDSCLATINEDRYKAYLQEFRDAGVNLIRVWGGGLKEKDSFYRLADEMGLMIMQEFPLACQTMARTEKFYRLLEQEVTAILYRLRKYSSIIIWSGGNEHYYYMDNVDSGTDTMNAVRDSIINQFKIDEKGRDWKGGADKYDEPSLALMGYLCALYDGSRPFQITSAMEGEGEVHGTWTWNPAIGDQRYRDYETLYEYWLNIKDNFFSECSVSSIANLKTIQDILQKDGTNIDYTQKEDPVWNMHHAFNAAWGSEDLWLDIPSTEKLFGKLDRVEDFIFANQWMQGEGCRFIIEELRRKIGKTCGFIWWGINEPWPDLAGNALIDYYERPKLGWKFMKNAFRTTIISLRYENCVCRRLKPELWISHDGVRNFEGKYKVIVRNLTSGEEDKYLGSISCREYSSQYIRMLTPVRMQKGVAVHVECKLYLTNGELVHTNDYVFGSSEDKQPFGEFILEYMKKLH